MKGGSVWIFLPAFLRMCETLNFFASPAPVFYHRKAGKQKANAHGIGLNFQ
jgi:hypothetical protein